MNDARRLGRNFAAGAVAQLFAQVLTFVISIVLARSLDVREYGIFVFGFAFPNLFLLFVSLGIDDVLAIEVAANRRRAPTYLTLIAVLRVVLSAAAFAALWVATSLASLDPGTQAVTLLLGTAGLLSTFTGTFTATFQAFERLEYAALVRTVERIVTAAAAILLLSLGFGVLEVSMAFVGGAAIMLGLAMALAKWKFAWFRGSVRLAELGPILRTATPFALAAAVGTFTMSAGLVLLTFLRGPVATGLFNASFTLVLALTSFLSIGNQAVLPTMARLHAESPGQLMPLVRRLQRISFMVGLPLSLGGWFYATEIVGTIYGPAFLASADSFRILILSFALLTGVMGYGAALAAIGKMKVNLYVNAAGAVTTVGLSFALIPAWGPVGAALAFLASNVIMAALWILAVDRLFTTAAIRQALPKPLVAGSLMIVVLSVMHPVSVWGGILVGGIAYVAVLLGSGGTTSEDRRIIRQVLGGALFR